MTLRIGLLLSLLANLVLVAMLAVDRRSSARSDVPSPPADAANAATEHPTREARAVAVRAHHAGSNQPWAPDASMPSPAPMIPAPGERDEEDLITHLLDSESHCAYPDAPVTVTIPIGPRGAGELQVVPESERELTRCLVALLDRISTPPQAERTYLVFEHTPGGMMATTQREPPLFVDDLDTPGVDPRNVALGCGNRSDSACALQAIERIVDPSASDTALRASHLMRLGRLDEAQALCENATADTSRFFTDVQAALWRRDHGFPATFAY
ncbi:MAG: hypothetical protein AAGE52_07680 [Myxococcota bacterium]